MKNVQKSFLGKRIVDRYDLKIANTLMAYIGTFPVTKFHSVSLNRFELATNRFMDIVGAMVGLFITGITSVFVIPTIKLLNPGTAICCKREMPIILGIFFCKTILIL